MKIIYIHGFNSGGVGNGKVALLRQQDFVESVQTTNLPPSPDDAIEALTDLINLHRVNGHLPTDLVLVGTSLGGYYAHYLSKTFGIKAVLINPSTIPLETLVKKIGDHTNYVTGDKYTFTTDMVNQLAKYSINPGAAPRVPTLVCLDMGDDVLDANIALTKFADHAKIISFPGGSHRFEHMADILPDIEKLEHIIYQ
jgi:predicted esterase YcpF (UPF0227 family)